MMSRKMLLLASVGIVSLQMIAAQECSAVCNACCAAGPNGEKRSPSIDGDCIDEATGKAACYLETGRCLNGKAAVPCEAVHTPKMHITRGGVGANAREPVETTWSWLAEGTPAWDVLQTTALPGKEARLINVPQGMLLNTPWSLQTPKATNIEKDNVMTFQCSYGSACNIVIFLYECSPCESEKANLPALLMGDDFVRTRCAPSFTNGRTDTLHRMTSYTKTLPVNGRYEFVSPGRVEFVVFGMSLHPLPECDTLDQMECGNTNGHCSWKGRCEVTTCVQQGPGGGCDTQTCVKKELA